ncbi:protein kinase [Streptomyces sp. NPDC048156]|uniref:caspase, EACC1-associated type n=1 Tax=Streptomyces sp. NPDC048156 TaxID=3365502 RepID=UPI0037135B5B
MPADPSSLPDPAQSHAVLIGFARYSHAPDLPAIDNNLKALQEFFTSTAGWGLPAEHCHVIRQAATANDLITPLRSAAAAARDTLLVYYAGHGILDEDMEFSLSLPASRLDEPWTGVSYTWVKRFIARARAKRRIAVLDSCFSGKAHAVMGSTSEAVKGQAAAAGTTVITSARDDRVALAPAGETYTAFTGELLNVLHEGEAGGPAVLTIDQVYECVKQALAAKGRPRPDRTGSDTCGHTAIVANRAFVPAAPAAEPRALAHRNLRSWVARLEKGPEEAASAAPPRTPAIETGTAATGFETQVPGNPARSRPPAKRNPRPAAQKTLANGRYETISMMAVGGMGEVYLCRDTVLGRTVVIKRVRSDWAKEMRAEHLRDEARAAAALNHPSIAAVFDVVQEASDQYMIMEYVPGWELGAAAATTRPTVQETLAAALDILDGLEHSHAAGIIHCDIKPSNLILTPQGRIKILDFGISSINESIHKDGMISGTRQYMPPESLSGEPPHVTRDIFSTGAVLYELITGQCIHHGDWAWHQGPLQRSPRASALVPDLPPGVEALIEKAIALHPDRRFSSAAQMRAEVEHHM